MEPITNNLLQLRNDDGEIIAQQEVAQHLDYIHVATSDRGFLEVFKLNRWNKWVFVRQLNSLK